jgi:heat shock protein HslJ
METEKLFLEALGKTSRFRITRQHLELLDDSGTVLADLEAVYLR